MRRQTRRRDTIVIDPDPKIPVSNVHLIPIAEASHRPGSTGTPSNLSTGSSLSAVIEQLPRSHDTSAFPRPHILRSSSIVPSISLSTLPSGRHISTVNDVIPTAPGPNSTSDSALAVEEARFLRRLYDRNAPANEIAELLQAMREREEANSEMAASSRHAGPQVESRIAHPAYLDGRG